MKLRLNCDPDEDALQQSIADLLDWILPAEIAWSHFPAGGYQLTKAAQARLYRLGLKRGWPDIEIAYSRGRTLRLEVKTRHGRLSRQQEDRIAQLQALGHPVVVVRRVEDVIAALRTYDVPYKRARLAEGFDGKAVEGRSETAQASRPQVGASIGPS